LHRRRDARREDRGAAAARGACRDRAQAGDRHAGHRRRALPAERNRTVDVEEAQRSFARWIALGTRAGLALLVAGFAAYLTGLLPPHVPLADLAASWHLPLAQFAAATGAPAGWQWLALAGRGDYFNFLGI